MYMYYIIVDISRMLR